MPEFRVGVRRVGTGHPTYSIADIAANNDGSLERAKKYLFKLWDLGVIAFFCGHGPHRVRMLPPFGVLTDAQWKHVFQLLDRAIGETAREFSL